MDGVSRIKVGFIQLQQFFLYTARYRATEALKSVLQNGKFYLDSNAESRPFYWDSGKIAQSDPHFNDKSKAMLFWLRDRTREKTIQMSDSPNFGVPALYNMGSEIKSVNDDTVKQIDTVFRYITFVAAETLDAPESYWADDSVGWVLNALGNVGAPFKDQHGWWQLPYSPDMALGAGITTSRPAWRPLSFEGLQDLTNPGTGPILLGSTSNEMTTQWAGNPDGWQTIFPDQH